MPLVAENAKIHNMEQKLAEGDLVSDLQMMGLTELNRRLHRSNIETTAYIKELYKSAKGHNIKCVSYTYCVDNVWYNGHTSPPDSIWDNIQPGDPFEIVYEKGNPSNSNWVGYYKK